MDLLREAIRADGSNCFLRGQGASVTEFLRKPLNVTIFITYVRNLRNGCYANEMNDSVAVLTVHQTLSCVGH